MSKMGWIQLILLLLDDLHVSSGLGACVTEVGENPWVTCANRGLGLDKVTYICWRRGNLHSYTHLEGNFTSASMFHYEVSVHKMDFLFRILGVVHTIKSNLGDWKSLLLHLHSKVFVLCQLPPRLAYLHSQNPPLGHHGLSPNNVLLNVISFMTKPTDFGMSWGINPFTISQIPPLKASLHLCLWRLFRNHHNTMRS